jgi:hypothetical protein
LPHLTPAINYSEIKNVGTGREVLQCLFANYRRSFPIKVNGW